MRAGSQRFRKQFLRSCRRSRIAPTPAACFIKCLSDTRLCRKYIPGVYLVKFVVLFGDIRSIYTPTGKIARNQSMSGEIPGDLLQWRKGFSVVASSGSIVKAMKTMGREQPTLAPDQVPGRGTRGHSLLDDAATPKMERHRPVFIGDSALALPIRP